MSLTPEEIEYMTAHAGDNKGPSVIVANIICLVPVLAAVSLRIWARRLTAAGFGWDDWWIIMSSVNCTKHKKC